MVTVEEMKQYLRVDAPDEDGLIEGLIQGATRLCMDILRTDTLEDLEKNPNAKTALLYTVAYQYEHREEADFHALTLSLRSLLLGDRREVF